MKPTVLITGKNGALAKRFKQLLHASYKIKFLTTDINICDNDSIFYWNIYEKYIDEQAVKNCDHIIHLAGYPIIKRWTKKNRKKMHDSRIKTSELLFDYCKKLNTKPKTFISASAIGIYGLNSNGEKNEKDISKNDWVSKMAIDWEEAANNFKQIGSRVVIMRISLLLSEKSLFLKSYLISMKFGIAISLGSKKRRISWIHIDDAVNFIHEAINNKNYVNAYNLAVENSVTQEQLIQTIKKERYPYAITINIPAFIIQFILKERSSIIMPNIIADVKKLKDEGFIFNFNSFDKVIKGVK